MGQSHRISVFLTTGKQNPEVRPGEDIYQEDGHVEAQERGLARKQP